MAAGFEKPDTANAVEPEKGLSRFPLEVRKLRGPSWANREELIF